MISLDHLLLTLSAKLKTPYDTVHLTTSEFGSLLGVSQQTASRYLQILGKEGLIERSVKGRGQQVKLTSKGIKRLKSLHNRLSKMLAKKSQFVAGTVVRGLEEGAYYVRQYSERIEKILGFKPYPGTLNIKVEENMPELGKYDKYQIEGFRKGNRQLGALSAYPVRLHYRSSKVNCYLITPERTHHKGILELINQHALRKKLSLKEGSKVKVELLA